MHAPMTDGRRVTALNEGGRRSGPVIYWMSRDMRVNDNWALLFAQERALEQKVPLAVVFCLVPEFLGACLRQYEFLLEGLQEVEGSLERLDIPFFLLEGPPGEQIVRFVRDRHVAVLVTDFDPLRVKKEWKERVGAAISIPFYEVDGHNIVPCRLVSPKQEFSARTIRPKLSRLLPEFLEPFPQVTQHPFPWKEGLVKADWARAGASLSVDTSVPPVGWLKPGERAGRRALHAFLKGPLSGYGEGRNDPVARGQSDLSPYLHFGHLSAQGVALEVAAGKAPMESKEVFLEQLIVRRELADNFCFYNGDYDRFEGFPRWARETLLAHSLDPRYVQYGLKEFEEGATGDELWNAAQTEMVKRGKMHGYLRMYWAKKILEWTGSPEEALSVAIYLNDKYELDGRDPNGYTGIAWSIGGLHDRPWGERTIFGKIRFMSYSGMKRKMDVARYVDYVRSLPG
jgi:deoxyribodipyrimidine photo-lyase